MVLEYLPTFSYIYLKKGPNVNVGKYSSTMEHLGISHTIAMIVTFTNLASDLGPHPVPCLMI